MESRKNAYLQRLTELTEKHNLLGSFAQNFPGVKTFTVLSIACGSDTVEVEALTEHFDTHGYQFNYLGIDIASEDIKNNQKKYQHHKNIRFKELDITAIDEISKEMKGESAHLIISRHPVLWETNSDSCYFNYALTQTVPALLASGGAFLVSLYHEEEKNTCLAQMKKVTSQAAIELKESKDNLYLNELRSYYLSDVVVGCYSDRHFLAYLNFSETNPPKKRPLLSDLFPSKKETNQKIEPPMQIIEPLM